MPEPGRGDRKRDQPVPSARLGVCFIRVRLPTRQHLQGFITRTVLARVARQSPVFFRQDDDDINHRQGVDEIARPDNHEQETTIQ